MPTRASKKRPRDLNLLAISIVEEATGERLTNGPIEPEPPSLPKNVHAQALAALGASKGGKARAAKLTAEQRREIAKKAAQARWQREEGQFSESSNSVKSNSA